MNCKNVNKKWNRRVEGRANVEKRKNTKIRNKGEAEGGGRRINGVCDGRLCEKGKSERKMENNVMRGESRVRG